MHTMRSLFVAFCLVALSACAAGNIQQPQPKSLNVQRVERSVGSGIARSRTCDLKRELRALQNRSAVTR